MDIFYIDGKFVPADQAALPINDLAILRGFGVFDYLIGVRCQVSGVRNDKNRTVRYSS